MKNLFLLLVCVFAAIFFMALGGLWSDVLAYAGGEVRRVEFSELRLIQKKRFSYGGESRRGTIALVDFRGGEIGVIYYGSPSGVVLLRRSDNVRGLVLSDLGRSVDAYMIYRNRFTYFATSLVKVLSVALVGGVLLLILLRSDQVNRTSQPKHGEDQRAKKE